MKLLMAAIIAIIAGSAFADEPLCRSRNDSVTCHRLCAAMDLAREAEIVADTNADIMERGIRSARAYASSHRDVQRKLRASNQELRLTVGRCR